MFTNFVLQKVQVFESELFQVDLDVVEKCQESQIKWMWANFDVGNEMIQKFLSIKSLPCLRNLDIDDIPDYPRFLDMLSTSNLSAVKDQLQRFCVVMKYTDSPPANFRSVLLEILAEFETMKEIQITIMFK